MPLADLTPAELEIVRRAMAATFEFLSFDFETRLGVQAKEMQNLLAAWPRVDDSSDESSACLAVNNAMNDLLHGIGISEDESSRLLGAPRVEVLRVYRKWVESRGWSGTGVR